MISINTRSNIVTFSIPADGKEFESYYNHEIRPIVDWHTLRQIGQVKQMVITSKRELGQIYTIWGRDGLPWYMVKKIKVREAAKKPLSPVYFLGNDSSTRIYRLPAVEWQGKIMLLDGNHRAVWLYKSSDLYVVILDILVLPDDSNSVLDIVTGGLNE